MTLAQVHGFMAAIARADTVALTRAALAARVAQADEKGWTKIMKEWSRGQ